MFFDHDHLLVGLSTELQENYWTDFQETRMVDVPQPRIDHINIWYGSGQRQFQDLFLTFITIAIYFQHFC